MNSPQRSPFPPVPRPSVPSLLDAVMAHRRDIARLFAQFEGEQSDTKSEPTTPTPLPAPKALLVPRASDTTSFDPPPPPRPKLPTEEEQKSALAKIERAQRELDDWVRQSNAALSWINHHISSSIATRLHTEVADVTSIFDVLDWLKKEYGTPSVQMGSTLLRSFVNAPSLPSLSSPTALEEFITSHNRTWNLISSSDRPIITEEGFLSLLFDKLPAAYDHVVLRISSGPRDEWTFAYVSR